MKIFFIAPANSTHTEKWLSVLVKRGHEIFCLYCINHAPKNIIQGVKYLSLKIKAPMGYYLNSTELRKCYNQIKPDIVNAHYASGNGTLLRKSGLKNSILNVWGSDVYDFPHKNFIFKKILEKNLKFARKIVSTSHDMALVTQELLPNETIDISVIPFGVDLKQFILHKKKFQNNVIFGVIKILKDIYGIKYLIHAFSQVVTRFKQEENDIKLSLLIYGDGEAKESLEELSKQLMMQDKIHFNGFIKNKDVPIALESIDICVIPSLQESFGVAAVEAMAKGLPVIGTKVGGLKEVIEDRKTGILVEPKNIEQLAEAMYNLAIDSGLRVNYGINARKKVEALYNLDDNADKLIELYSTLIV